MQSRKELIKFIENCYQLYEQKMYQVAYGILRDSGWAEDAVQNAFVKLMKSRTYFKDAESDDCKRYLITIIKHAAIDIYQKKKREYELISFSDADTYREPALVQNGETEDVDVKELISNLPPRYYEVVDCLVVRNLSVRETSGKLGISEANVRKRFERAKKMLKIAWEGSDTYETECRLPEYNRA